MVTKHQTYLKHIQMAELHNKYNLLKNGGSDMLQQTKGMRIKTTFNHRLE